MADADADLLAELSKLRQRLAGLTGRLEDQEGKLQEAFEQLGAIAEVLGSDPDFALSPWWWPAMTQSQAGEAWKTLTTWVDGAIISRYDDGERQLDGAEWALKDLRHSNRVLRCWFAHPPIVDRLSALHWAQRGDYRRGALSHGPLDWQETWLPKTLDGMLAEFTEKHCYGSCPYYNAGRADEDRRKHDDLGLRDRMIWIKADIERRTE